MVDFDRPATPACGNPFRSFPQVRKEAELMLDEPGVISRAPAAQFKSRSGYPELSTAFAERWEKASTGAFRTEEVGG